MSVLQNRGKNQTIVTSQVRIDKYLWAVRIFKTRTMATDACKTGKVLMDDLRVKPSRMVQAGDIIRVRKMPVIYSYRVIEPIEKRVGAKLVERFVLDITPPEELLKLKMEEDFFVKRDRGSGRPTKKERRLLDGITGE
ncbi:MAG: RNA-binding S4 domain-containing protein [Bacteroidales bacterium]|nr:RNA-binding S4 domain-containing protein [Bacteroidales bacterium]